MVPVVRLPQVHANYSKHVLISQQQLVLHNVLIIIVDVHQMALNAFLRINVLTILRMPHVNQVVLMDHANSRLTNVDYLYVVIGN